LDLTPEQRRKLSREEVASMFDNGIRFEAVLEAGFALRIAQADDITDPRITYLCHEMGEETRHQRLFQRVIQEIRPTARNPLAANILIRWFDRFGTRWILNHPATLYTMVISGEEIPDLLQKLASEHPDTDPFLASVNRYHRQEEARHLSFARSMLAEVWADAGRGERWGIHHVVPVAIRQMYEFLVHPGVYETVGLEGWPTWKAVNKLPERIAVREQATRPILGALIDAGMISPKHVPKGWQNLCGVPGRVDRSTL
ncbi:MAG TPA: diiron oxygenase, partial [Acidimicrobiales bacterium]|nr:diiron oxygenase [Acidimicrobiales bacterium]